MSNIGVGLTRNEGETWREAVIRYARPHGLEFECLDEFDGEVQRGGDPARAAWSALQEWDCLSLFVDGKEHRS